MENEETPPEPEKTEAETLLDAHAAAVVEHGKGSPEARAAAAARMHLYLKTRGPR